MGTPVLAPGKKRYSVTLTQANVDRFQTLLKQTGMAGSISTICDSAIESTASQLQIFKDKGTIRIGDLFGLIGQQMDLIEDERRENYDQKREKAPRRSKVAKRGN